MRTYLLEEFEKQIGFGTEASFDRDRYVRYQMLNHGVIFRNTENSIFKTILKLCPRFDFCDYDVIGFDETVYIPESEYFQILAFDIISMSEDNLLRAAEMHLELPTDKELEATQIIDDEI